MTKLTEAQTKLLYDMENYEVVIQRFDWYDMRQRRMCSSLRTHTYRVQWDGKSVHPGTVRALLAAGLIAFENSSTMPCYYRVENA